MALSAFALAGHFSVYEVHRLVRDEKSNVITHNLNFPIGDGDEVKKLEYRPRLNDRLLEPYLKGVKASDSDGRLTAYICALTQKASGIIKNIDSVDKKISIAIAVFFL